MGGVSGCQWTGPKGDIYSVDQGSKEDGPVSFIDNRGCALQEMTPSAGEWVCRLQTQAGYVETRALANATRVRYSVKTRLKKQWGFEKDNFQLDHVGAY